MTTFKKNKRNNETMIETNKIYNEDCLETMSKIPDNCIDLIVTSPPYNKSFWSSNQNINNGFKTKSRFINYDCDFNDCMIPEEYINWQKKIIKECCRILKPEGSFFYNHIDILNNHNTIHPSFVYEFPLKQILIWNRRNTPKLDKSYFFPINEYVFWLKKDFNSKPKFNRKNSIFDKSIFNLNPDNKNNHPAPFPIELPGNFILACTDENDLIYDPFMGSGTTAIAAIKNNRKFIGSELSKKYINDFEKRLEIINSQPELF